MNTCLLHLLSACLAAPKLQLQIRRNQLNFPSIWENPILRSLPMVPSASSSSSFPPAEYPVNPEILPGTRSKRKRQIAGVDQEELQDPAILADPDSCFCEFKGVQIHHKIYDAESVATNLSEEGTSSQPPYANKRVNFPMILLHGFGASIYSWIRAMKPLAQITGNKVLAFDRPAFGLTARLNHVNHSSQGSEDTRPFNPYSMLFSVLATLYFIDFLAAQKAILVGHSAGSIVAVEAYFEAPERVAALILVAPAILAPLNSGPVVKDNPSGKSNQSEGEDLEVNCKENWFTTIFSILSKLSQYIGQTITRLVKGMGDMITSIYKKALSAFLRSAIGIMLPLRVKDWDRALVEYTVAMLTDSASASKPPLSKRLRKILCPVLIITGDSDRLVPPWNSERLSRAIPGSCLEIIKKCGHLPHEEKVDEFVSIVDRFLERAFGV
ncbi:2-hydroxy-6-oxononadienedioate/2-hydroxy-6-oxononatrienedioate hydrolase isoform X8 [Capsicum annuum]|uniref:2-hydroxy-6-oxononadienedioate/2-hydroxy-6- oxononatrienedioate hydrolase isoform X8 n=1 Tax=Capsicum annuum TaxID=4072 RepID=UPI001FB0AE10|nr:2-hydroxy-6-oxononadienedioate/2-hydroxy-6-oxononatrienedioate hydrolase isoform X8 [Capsicum annuum]